MRRKTMLLIPLAVVFAFALTACLFSDERAYTEGQVTDTIRKDGKKTEVTVDLRDGWACEFSNATIYMYNSDKRDNASITGLVMWQDTDLYDEAIEDGKEYDSFTEENGVTSYTDENGYQYRLFIVNDEVPVLMQMFDGVDADDFYGRITFGDTE